MGVDIKGGDNGQPALEHIELGVLVGKHVFDVAGEIRVLLNAIRRRYGGIEHKILGFCGVVLFLSDIAVRQHAIEDQITARIAIVRIIDGVVIGRRLGDADKRCRFRQRQISCIFREISLGSRLDTISTRTVIHGVQVHEEDVVFRVHLLDFDGKVHLADLALKRDIVHLVGEHRVAHELLRDG